LAQFGENWRNLAKTGAIWRKLAKITKTVIAPLTRRSCRRGLGLKCVPRSSAGTCSSHSSASWVLAGRHFSKIRFGQNLFGHNVFGQKLFGQKLFGHKLYPKCIQKEHKLFGHKLFGDKLFGQSLSSNLSFRTKAILKIPSKYNIYKFI
jgi:hypothetical protein